MKMSSFQFFKKINILLLVNFLIFWKNFTDVDEENDDYDNDDRFANSDLEAELEMEYAEEWQVYVIKIFSDFCNKKIF